MTRRVPKCSGQDFCPFRSNLCRGKCRGTDAGQCKPPTTGDTVVLDREAYILTPGEDGPVILHYIADTATLAYLRDFDAGKPLDRYMGKTLSLLAPVRDESPTAGSA
jgi:hypothetical protein